MKKKEEQVARLVEAMARLMMKTQEVDDTCVRLSKDIEKRDLMIVCFVGERGRVIMKEIAEYMDIPVSTTTGIVDKLVQKGYLSREFSPTDRRSIQIALSRHGNQTCDMMTKMKHKMAGRMLDDLTDKEGEALITLLEKVTNNLQKHVPVG